MALEGRGLAPALRDLVDALRERQGLAVALGELSLLVGELALGDGRRCRRNEAEREHEGQATHVTLSSREGGRL